MPLDWQSRGNANPDTNFRYDSSLGTGRYVFNQKPTPMRWPSLRETNERKLNSNEQTTENNKTELNRALLVFVTHGYSCGGAA